MTDEVVLLSPSAKVGQFIERSRRRFSDGITLSDFAGVFLDAMRLAIAAVDAVPMDGSARKIAVMVFAGEIFDTFAPKVVPPMLLPVWLLFKAPVRAAFLSFASGAIESLLPLVREAGE